jgi:FMN phosphatase YigB (HAD superfamily)
VGVEKPDPAIFAFALEALDLPAERCIYVGDSVHFDVNGASAAGIAAVHLMPFQSCVGDAHPHAGSLEVFADRLLAGEPTMLAPPPSGSRRHNPDNYTE